jgi:hypothetical protein
MDFLLRRCLVSWTRRFAFSFTYYRDALSGTPSLLFISKPFGSLGLQFIQVTEELALVSMLLL